MYDTERWKVYTSVCVVSHHPVNFHTVKTIQKDGYLTRVIAKYIFQIKTLIKKTSLPAEGILFPSTDLWIPNLEQHHYLSTDANRKLQRALRKYAAEE